MRPLLHPRLRRALVNMAQDLLDLSEYLSKATTVLQTLQDQKSRLCQRYLQVDEQDMDSKSDLESKIARIDVLVESLGKEIKDARERKLPAMDTRFYLRLKNLHGRLLFSKIEYRTPGRDENWEARQTEFALKRLLSVPVPNVLEELALHLLSTSRPFSQNAFFIMIHQLSGLRYGSAARSAYFHLIDAGYPPDSRKTISLLLTLALSIRDKKEFSRLRKLVDLSNMAHDAHTYGTLIVGSAKMGHVTNAKRYLQAMAADGITPTLKVLTSLLHDCGTRRNWRLGEQIWRLLKASSIKSGAIIDALAYYEMWRLCKRCRQTPMARTIYGEALDAGFGPRDITMRPPIKRRPIRPGNKVPSLRDYDQAVQYLILRSRTPRDRAAFSQQARLPNPVSDQSRIIQMLKSYRHTAGRPGGARWDEFMSFSVFAQSQPKRLQKVYSHWGGNPPSYLFDLQKIISNEPPEPVELSLPSLSGPSFPAAIIHDEHVSDIIQEATNQFIANAIRMSNNPLSRRRYNSRSQDTLSFRLRLIASHPYPIPVKRAVPIRWRRRRPRRIYMELSGWISNAWTRMHGKLGGWIRRPKISSRRSGHGKRRRTPNTARMIGV